MADKAFYYTTRTGRKNVVFTQKDEWMLRELTRWYALSPAHLYRIAHAKEKHLWHPNFGAEVLENAYGEPVYPTDAKGVSADGVRAFRRRMAVWNASTPRLMRATELNPQVIGYSATTMGAAMIERPEWVHNNRVNPLLLRHAFAAADIGLQIKSYGFPVASEREVRRGRLLNGAELAGRFSSDYYDGKTGKTVGKEPDLAVIAADKKHYVAVEIERDRNRPLPVYEQKLGAYRANPHITSVWYVCGSKTTARRVIAARTKVYGDNPHRVRVRVVDQNLPFWHIPYFNASDNQKGVADPELAADLTELVRSGRARRTAA